MTYDRACDADVEQLVELRLAYIREDSGALSQEDEARIRHDLPDYFARNLNDAVIGFVAREDGALVACALLLLVEKPMSPKFINGKTGTVMNVYTRPEHRGKGVARQLMTLLMREVADRSLSVVELKATEMGYPLYKSMGFKDDPSNYHGMKWTSAIC